MARDATDKRNRRVIVRVYAGIDPRTGKKRFLRVSFAPGTPVVAMAAACDVVNERARFMKLDERARFMKRVEKGE